MAETSRGFSFLELLIVLVIVGVLASIGIRHFSTPKEQGLRSEALSNLKLIAAAERIYRLESGAYAATGSTQVTNDVLRLILPTNVNRQWDYAVTVSGSQFTIRATRLKGHDAGTSWCLSSTNLEETNMNNLTCP